MKFKSELGYYENLKAWEEHYRNAPHTQYSSLNESEKRWLVEFSESLRKLEDKYFQILVAKYDALNSRVVDPTDWMMEFNLSYVITFYLREDDPEYEEIDDNILMQIDESFLGRNELDQNWGFGATQINHACSQDEHHCYLYRQLYNRFGLDWSDFFRIGCLYVDIKIDEQSGSLPMSLRKLNRRRMAVARG